MGEVVLRAPAQIEEADPLVEHPEVAAHPWVASVYLIRDQLEGPGRRSGEAVRTLGPLVGVERPWRISAAGSSEKSVKSIDPVGSAAG